VKGLLLLFYPSQEGRAGRGRTRPHPSNPQAHPLEGEAAYILLFVDPIFNMSANEDTRGSERKRLRCLDDDDAANFVYTGQENGLEGVIHVRIHPSSRVIRARAFFRQTRLIGVEFYDGIEVIEKEAFEECRSLCKILFPPAVKAIKEGAFNGCSGLTTVILNDGLEVIGEWWEFRGCALVCIDIPPSVRMIQAWAFRDCSRLATAILNDGLEVIYASIYPPPTGRSRIMHSSIARI